MVVSTSPILTFSYRFKVVISNGKLFYHSGMEPSHQLLILNFRMATGSVLPHHVPDPCCFGQAQVLDVVIALFVSDFYLTNDWKDFCRLQVGYRDLLVFHQDRYLALGFDSTRRCGNRCIPFFYCLDLSGLDRRYRNVGRTPGNRLVGCILRQPSAGQSFQFPMSHSSG